jgi:hypothetical protein
VSRLNSCSSQTFTLSLRTKKSYRIHRTTKASYENYIEHNSHLRTIFPTIFLTSLSYGFDQYRIRIAVLVRIKATLTLEYLALFVRHVHSTPSNSCGEPWLLKPQDSLPNFESTRLGPCASGERPIANVAKVTHYHALEFLLDADVSCCKA